MPNAWLNHVRQFRKNNKNMSYKQLLKQAKNSYSGGGEEKTTMQHQQGGGEEAKPMPATSGLQSAMQSLRAITGGGVTGFESRSSLTRSASSVGGRRSSRSNQSKQSRTRSSRKTRRSRR